MTLRKSWRDSDIGEWWGKQMERVGTIIEDSDDAQLRRIASTQRDALICFEMEMDEADAVKYAGKTK